MNKRLRFDTDEDDVTVPANPSDLAVELDNTKKLLNFAQLESRQKSETITDLNNQIVRMQQHLEDQEIEIEGNHLIAAIVGHSVLLRNRYPSFV